MKEEKKFGNENSYYGYYEGYSCSELKKDELDGIAGGVDVISGKKDEEAGIADDRSVVGPFFGQYNDKLKKKEPGTVL